MIHVLFIGDVVGRPGRRVLLQHLPGLRARYAPALVIANAENAAAGFGVTEAIVTELLEAGVDLLTSGNHIWDRREALNFIDRQPRLLRPHNYPPGTPGSGWWAGECGGLRIGVLNLMGQVFMQPVVDCPFRCAEAALARHGGEVDAVVVDFHGEASSEKQALGRFLDGRVAAVLGSHTHVPTADEGLLPGGTAYITDAGMTGCYDSIIGMEVGPSVERFTTRLARRLEVARGPARLCGVRVALDPAGGRARAIERLRLEEA